MDRTEFIELMLEEIQPVDLSVFKSVLEFYRANWFHKQSRFYILYGEIIAVLEEVDVPEVLPFVLHSLVKEVFGDLRKVKHLTESEYRTRLTWLYRSIRSLEVKVVDQEFPDFETIKIAVRNEE
jgi:hypothetical protein